METGLSGRNGKATKHNAKMPTQAGVAATVNVMFDIFRFHNAHSSLNPLPKAIHPSIRSKFPPSSLSQSSHVSDRSAARESHQGASEVAGSVCVCLVFFEGMKKVAPFRVHFRPRPKSASHLSPLALPCLASGCSRDTKHLTSSLDLQDLFLSCLNSNALPMISYPLPPSKFPKLFHVSTRQRLNHRRVVPRVYTPESSACPISGVVCVPCKHILHAR